MSTRGVHNVANEWLRSSENGDVGFWDFWNHPVRSHVKMGRTLTSAYWRRLAPPLGA